MLSEPTGGLCSVQTNTGPPEYRKWRRGHGLQLPLHPQQVVGWIALGFSAATCFLVLVPALTVHLQPALLTIFSILYLFHCISHITALLLDPADPALRRLKAATKQPVPEFDRTKHAHVIENGRCHLCNIQTSSPRTKHCSVCNKCVGKFDHHCKWLNHCIGGRNYASFLMCVTSAVVTAIAVLLVCLGEIIVYYVNPQWLSQWIDPALQHSNTSTTTHSTTTNPPSGTSTTSTPQSSDAAFLVIVGALGILAAITAGLLLHLCFFHVYISFLGLTTYEYIRAYRPNLMSTAPPPSEPSLPPNTIRHRPSTLHCCDRTGNNVSSDNTRSNVTFYACAIVENNKCRPPRTNGFTCCSAAAATRRRPNHISDSSYRNDPSTHSDIGGIVSGGGDGGVSKLNQSSPAPMDECKCCGIITVTSSSSTTMESASDVSGISGTSATSFKSPLKKQRFHGKWNCCSAVPDSPDDSRYMNTNHDCVLSLCKFKSKPKTNSISASNVDPPAPPAAPTPSRPPTVEWYGARRPSRAALRIRLLFRVLSNLRTRRRHNQPTNHLNPNQYRNNQVVPLSERNGSANEQPPQTILGGPVLLPPLPAAPLTSRRRLITNTISTSGILSDTSTTTSATAAPDLLLVDSLSTISAQSIGSIRRYRRRHRRHTVLHNRPKSPTLSPIHESGLSNPASPVPCRHSVCSGAASTLIDSADVANGHTSSGGGGGVLESCLNGGLVPSTQDSLEYTTEKNSQFRHVR